VSGGGTHRATRSRASALQGSVHGQSETSLRVGGAASREKQQPTSVSGGGTHRATRSRASALQCGAQSEDLSSKVERERRYSKAQVFGQVFKGIDDLGCGTQVEFPREHRLCGMSAHFVGDALDVHYLDG
jgi:hypothetical protein